MENDRIANPPTPAIRVEGTPGARPAPPRRRSSGLVFLVIAVLVLAGAVLAWWLLREQRELGSARADAAGVRIDQIERANEQLRRDLDALRARLGDAETVNRSVREELLGSNERSRALEDALANLADQRLTSRDALALNEAEFVLQLAGERLGLFQDAAAAIAAYRLADSALTAAEDPLFASVRQTIAAEMAALEAAQPLQTQATLGALATLRGNIATLPTRSATPAVAPGDDQQRSRFARIFGQFVRISDDDSRSLLASRDDGLARSLAAIDVRGAEAALFARDADAFASSLARARSQLAAAFDGDAEPVRHALAEIDRLAALPMAPALPELGSALRELRNLRTMRALSREPPAAPAPEATP